MLKSLKTYTIPIISLVLAIGIAFWRINYLERTNISLSGLRVGDSEERYLDLYGSPSVRDGIIDDLLHVKVENGVVTAIVMGHYD